MPARKNVEERIVTIDAKIAKKKEEIKNLEAQKKKLQSPINYRSVVTKAKESGMTAEEIAEKLGLKM